MRDSAISSNIIILMVLAAQTQIFSCRSRKKTAEIEVSSPKLAVTVMDLREEDQNQVNFRYILKNCGENETTGVVDKENSKTDPVVNFNVAGLEAGEVCSMNIKIDSLEAYPSKINFTDENLTMYKGSDAVVSQGLKGELITTIYMKPNYFHEISPLKPEAQYTINLSVQFPDTITASQNMAAFIQCQPEVRHLPSTFTSTSTTSGTFTFKVVHGGTGPEEHQCSKLTVYNGDSRSYFAMMNSQAFKFAATSGQTIQFNNQSIKLEKIIPPPSKVTLETIEKQCDPKNEVFDINKKACVPKPQ